VRRRVGPLITRHDSIR